MTAGDWGYIAQSINPLGGLLVSVPWGMLKMNYPLWLVLLTGPPLAYSQVLVVDLLWSTISRIPRVQAFLEKKRSPRVEKLLAQRGAFWPTFLVTPLIGGWGVMLAMRYVQVPQRRVALPILLSFSTIALVVGILCATVPHLFAKSLG